MPGNNLLFITKTIDIVILSQLDTYVILTTVCWKAISMYYSDVQLLPGNTTFYC